MHPTSFAPRKRNFPRASPSPSRRAPSASRPPLRLALRRSHRGGGQGFAWFGGGFKYFLEFSPRKLGKMNPFWLIFFRWVETTNFRSCANYVTITSMILVGDGPAASDAASAPAGADHGGELSNKDLTFCIQKSVKIRRICWWTCMKIPWYILGVLPSNNINEWLVTWLILLLEPFGSFGSPMLFITKMLLKKHDHRTGSPQGAGGYWQTTNGLVFRTPQLLVPLWSLGA